MTWPQLKKPSLLKFKTTKQRSANMRAIKATSNATTEARLRALLIQKGIRGWKIRQSSLPGIPDFFFTVQRVAVFVDGCFWHGCPRCGHLPKSNRSYWRNKLARNKKRDTRIRTLLERSGIRVMRIWECDLRSRPLACLNKISHALAPARRS